MYNNAELAFFHFKYDLRASTICGNYNQVIIERKKFLIKLSNIKLLVMYIISR